MRKDKISVIVPVYNVQKYIKKCLDSLINQTFKNLEIILVNDGSTDKSGEICRAYEKVDLRVKVINQENRGQAAARNRGLQEVTGNYISFIDSDDYIENNMYEVLYKALKENNADISITQVSMVDERGRLVSSMPNKNSKGNTETGLEAIERYLIQERWAIWDKLYKSEIFKGIKFLEGRTCSEDHLAIIPILKNVKKIITVDNYLYNYLVRKNSTTNSEFSIKTFDNAYVWEAVLEQSKTLNDKYENLVKRKLFCSYIDLINEYIRADVDIYNDSTNMHRQIKEIVKKVKAYNKETYTPDILGRYKVAGKLLSLGFETYKIFFKVIEIRKKI